VSAAPHKTQILVSLLRRMKEKGINSAQAKMGEKPIGPATHAIIEKGGLAGFRPVSGGQRPSSIRIGHQPYWLRSIPCRPFSVQSKLYPP
jgi:hypothetical protein